MRVRKFLLYSPLNQGLKPMGLSSRLAPLLVFTLQSIKSRIETGCKDEKGLYNILFLLYSPLNQGLKLKYSKITYYIAESFYSTVH